MRLEGDIELGIYSKDAGIESSTAKQCPEFMSAACHELTTAMRTHRYVCIDSNRELSLHLNLPIEWKWQTGNTLRIRICHDNEDMYNSEVFIMNPETPLVFGAENALRFQYVPSHGLTAAIEKIPVSIKDINDKERMIIMVTKPFDDANAEGNHSTLVQGGNLDEEDEDYLKLLSYGMIQLQLDLVKIVDAGKRPILPLQEMDGVRKPPELDNRELQRRGICTLIKRCYLQPLNDAIRFQRPKVQKLISEFGTCIWHYRRPDVICALMAAPDQDFRLSSSRQGTRKIFVGDASYDALPEHPDRVSPAMLALTTNMAASVATVINRSHDTGGTSGSTLIEKADGEVLEQGHYMEKSKSSQVFNTPFAGSDIHSSMLFPESASPNNTFFPESGIKNDTVVVQDRTHTATGSGVRISNGLSGSSVEAGGVDRTDSVMVISDQARWLNEKGESDKDAYECAEILVEFALAARKEAEQDNELNMYQQKRQGYEIAAQKARLDQAKQDTEQLASLLQTAKDKHMSELGDLSDRRLILQAMLQQKGDQALVAAKRKNEELQNELDTVEARNAPAWEQTLKERRKLKVELCGASVRPAMFHTSHDRTVQSINSEADKAQEALHKQHAAIQWFKTEIAAANEEMVTGTTQLKILQQTHEELKGKRRKRLDSQAKMQALNERVRLDIKSCEEQMTEYSAEAENLGRWKLDLERKLSNSKQRIEQT